MLRLVPASTKMGLKTLLHRPDPPHTMTCHIIQKTGLFLQYHVVLNQTLCCIVDTFFLTFFTLLKEPHERFYPKKANRALAKELPFFKQVLQILECKIPPLPPLSQKSGERSLARKKLSSIFPLKHVIIFIQSLLLVGSDWISE